MKTFFAVCFLLALSVSVYSQNTHVTVIAVQANLRGTPEANGLVVEKVYRDDRFELIKQQGSWFLVQTPKYVGWLHGNTIEMTTAIYEAPKRPKPLPANTVLDDSKESPFESEYIGGSGPPSLFVKNDTDRSMTLEFGGVKYSIRPQDTIEVEVDAGIYAYTASASGVRPYVGKDRFENGYRYTWSFYIRTVRY